jgi:hypothetical protein
MHFETVFKLKAPANLKNVANVRLGSRPVLSAPKFDFRNSPKPDIDRSARHVKKVSPLHHPVRDLAA